MHLTISPKIGWDVSHIHAIAERLAFDGFFTRSKTYVRNNHTNQKSH